MLRLMIVDDEQIIREALSEMVDYPSIGYELVATAKNGMEAFDIIRDEYPDVVVTDIRMPFINGLELIERSIKSDADISFVLLSGYGEFEYARQAMRYGVRHYLLKPTDRQELIDTLIAIRQERVLEEEKRVSERSQLLCSLQTSLEQCFLMKALAYEENFPSVYQKYLPLLPSSLDCCTACVCSYVKEPYMKSFAADARRLLELEQVSLCFSCIYIKNNMILIFRASSLLIRERIRRLLENLHYFRQSVAFEVRFLHEPAALELFRSILQKLARFQQICLVDQESHTYEIRNDPTTPWRISHLNASIASASDACQAASVLNTVFHDTMPTDTAKNLALGLFLKRWPESGTFPPELACDFFPKALQLLPDWGDSESDGGGSPPRKRRKPGGKKQCQHHTVKILCKPASGFGEPVSEMAGGKLPFYQHRILKQAVYPGGRPPLFGLSQPTAGGGGQTAYDRLPEREH